MCRSDGNLFTNFVVSGTGAILTVSRIISSTTSQVAQLTPQFVELTVVTSAKLDDAIPLAITSVVNPISYLDRLGSVTKLLVDATVDEFFMNDVSCYHFVIRMVCNHLSAVLVFICCNC